MGDVERRRRLRPRGRRRARTTLRRSSSIRERRPAADARSRPSLPASTPSILRRAAASAWRRRRSTDRPPTTSSSDLAPACRARSKCSARTCRQTPGTAPALFSSFSPYPDDSSGVSVASGFVDFATGRYSIVTAPGPGSPAQVKVFVYPLMTPIGPKTNDRKRDQGHVSRIRESPTLTAAFMPFGIDYRAACRWPPAGSPARSAARSGSWSASSTGPGAVKVFSSGSALQGGPATYLRACRP